MIADSLVGEWVPVIVAIVTTIGVVKVALINANRKVDEKTADITNALNVVKKENGEQHEHASQQRAAVAAKLSNEVAEAKAIAFAAVQAAAATTAALTAHAAEEDRRYAHIEEVLNHILMKIDPTGSIVATLPKSLDTLTEDFAS